MPTSHSSLYAAFGSNDTRLDGRYFVGVSSTRIYCRPLCKARRPKAENCTFFATAAEAEQAGYRPCLLCRPELAPGPSATDAEVDLAYRAARLLEENCADGQRRDEIANRLGCTEQHLHQVFTAEYHVAPLQYLQSCRLLLAKSLLTDTDLPLADIAMAAGFDSSHHLTDLFQSQYRLSPTALRKRSTKCDQHGGGVTLSLCYRPPYQWEAMLKFLAGRAITGVETVMGGEYMRTVRLVNETGEPIYGWVRVGHRPAKNALTVTVSAALLPVLPKVLARIRHLFDLHCDPHAVYEVLQAMNNTRPGLCVLGTRVPGCFDAFEMAVRAVLGQQITVKAASTLAARMVETYGTPVQTGIQGLTHVFPSPDTILALDGAIENHLGPLGVIASRSKTIYALAQVFVQKDIDFGLGAQPAEEMKKLMAIRGIGSWTAQYIAMRAMAWPDAFLETDAGVKKALQPHPPKEMLAMAEPWRPWRSYATVNLWNTL